MECPKCGSEKSRVVNSRHNYGSFIDGSIFRRRECRNCGTRYSTYEIRKDYLTPTDEDEDE